MARILLVAKNAFRAVMSQRALYVWAFAVVIMFLRSAPALFSQSNDAAVLTFIRANSVSGALQIWSILCMAAAIYLGSTSLPGELRTKTIITVLARPVHRWELLVGKWIGIASFCIVTLIIGVALGLLLASYLGVHPDLNALAMAATWTVGGILLFGGAAVAAGTCGSAPIAGALTMALVFLPVFVTAMTSYPKPWVHNTGVVLDYLLPPDFLGSNLYGGVVWAPFPVVNLPPGIPRRNLPPQERPTIDYGAEQKRTAESVAYGSAYFLLGCLFLVRRDIKFS